MLERESSSLGFIGDHGADVAQAAVHVIHVHDGQILFANLLPLRAIRNAGDDAVALPTIGHGRPLFMIARIDQQMPMRVLFGEVSDAANDAPAPARFRFDQHGNVLNAKLAVVDSRDASSNLITQSEWPEVG